MTPTPPLSSRYFRTHRLPVALAIGLVAALVVTALNAAPLLGVSATAGLAQTELRILQSRLDTLPIPPNPNVLLVTIERDTPKLLGVDGDISTVPRKYHAELIGHLRKAGAAVVFFDLLFDTPRTREGDDDLFVAIEESAPLPIVLAMTYDPEKSRSNPEAPTGWEYAFTRPIVIAEEHPENVLPASALAWDPTKAGDGVVLLRPDALRNTEVPHVALATVLAMKRIPPSSTQWDEGTGTLSAGPLYWECGVDREIITRFAATPFAKIEYSKALAVLSRPESAAEFRDKIVIIGDFTGSDEKPTRIGQMHGAEFNAHAVNTLLQSPVDQVGTWTLPISFLWSWMLAFLASGFLSTMRWRIVTPGSIGVLLLALVAPQLALPWLRIHVYTLTPALAVALSLLVTAFITSGLAEQLFPWHLRTRKSEADLEKATVVFVDLRDSTPMVKQLGAKRAGKAQAHLLSRLSAVIRAHDGEVERTMGDGLLALFRKRGKSPHAHRALTAVRAMLSEVEQISPEWQATFGVPAGITVGVETGDVLGHIISTGSSEEWSSSGLTLNIAARLQAACGPKGLDVLIGPGAHAAAADAFPMQPVGELELKGIGALEAAYTLANES